MRKSEFMELLQTELEIESIQLQEGTKIEDISEWDSLSVMTVLSLLDENFSLEFKISDLNKITSINDIIVLVGEDQFE